ncbi:MAG: hypothetical protein ACI9CF_001525 [Candidatus Omnitrophota bacterium]|jgi:hypothetical protein
MSCLPLPNPIPHKLSIHLLINNPYDLIRIAFGLRGKINERPSEWWRELRALARNGRIIFPKVIIIPQGGTKRAMVNV